MYPMSAEKQKYVPPHKRISNNQVEPTEISLTPTAKKRQYRRTRSKFPGSGVDVMARPHWRQSQPS